MNSRIENLLSRVVSLEERFNSRPSDVADLRRRDELRQYVTVLLYFRCSFPSSKLDLVGGQLQLLAEKPGLPQLTDHVQDNDDLFRPLDDLQEAILDYQVRSQPQARHLSTLTRTADGATEGNSQSGAWTDSELLHSHLGTRNDLSAGSRLEHLLALAFPMTIV